MIQFDSNGLKPPPRSYMGVSENSGFSSKSSMLIGFSIINHPFWGTPIFGNTQYIIYILLLYYIHIYIYFFLGGGDGISLLFHIFFSKDVYYSIICTWSSLGLNWWRWFLTYLLYQGKPPHRSNEIRALGVVWGIQGMKSYPVIWGLQ